MKYGPDLISLDSFNLKLDRSTHDPTVLFTFFPSPENLESGQMLELPPRHTSQRQCRHGTGCPGQQQMLGKTNKKHTKFKLFKGWLQCFF